MSIEHRLKQAETRTNEKQAKMMLRIFDMAKKGDKEALKKYETEHKDEQGTIIIYDK